MPPRSSRSSAHSLSSLSAWNTMLWVAVLFLSLGMGLSLLVTSMRLRVVEGQLLALSATVQTMAEAKLAPAPAPMPPAPLPVAAPVASPSGLLTRGSLTPDGTKYAGYDDTTKGKIGIAVEIVATKQVKHIEIFNPNTQSTGNGTPQESDMSVRWKDNSTIEYDVLEKQNGTWVKQVAMTKIYF